MVPSFHLSEAQTPSVCPVLSFVRGEDIMREYFYWAGRTGFQFSHSALSSPASFSVERRTFALEGESDIS